MKISIIVAVSQNGVIGKDNKLVWHLPDDMKFFKEKTLGHCVITGRKNYESIPEKYRPLSGRTNIVVTRQNDYKAPGAIVTDSIEKAIATAGAKGETECFIIGGADVYRQTLSLAENLYYTAIDHAFEGDAFFPLPDPAKWKLTGSRSHPVDDKHAYAFEIREYRKI